MRSAYFLKASPKAPYLRADKMAVEFVKDRPSFRRAPVPHSVQADAEKWSRFIWSVKFRWIDSEFMR
jgi:hypothetical protein